MISYKGFSIIRSCIIQVRTKSTCNKVHISYGYHMSRRLIVKLVLLVDKAVTLCHLWMWYNSGIYYGYELDSFQCMVPKLDSASKLVIECISSCNVWLVIIERLVSFRYVKATWIKWELLHSSLVFLPDVYHLFTLSLVQKNFVALSQGFRVWNNVGGWITIVGYSFVAI